METKGEPEEGAEAIIQEGVCIVRIKSKTFKAKYSAISRLWEVETGEIHFWCRYLRIKVGKEFNAPRNKYQIIRAENVEFELQDSWVVLISYERLKKVHLYNLYDPDHPKNLAKSVTVK